jgi:NAD(P)-dependent dehydrogenase (short-subunit alcohol dehydrogenase family)
MKNALPTELFWMITGTSRGFGAAIAAAALAAGDTAIGTGRKAEDVTRALGEPDHLLALNLDVTDPESAAAERVRRQRVS